MFGNSSSKIGFAKAQSWKFNSKSGNTLFIINLKVSENDFYPTTNIHVEMIESRFNDGKGNL